MKVLVTGGVGFIGSNLCKVLLKKGHEVVAVDNLITGSRQNVDALSLHPKFTFIHHDITKPLTSNQLPSQRRSSAQAATTINQIYHLACPTGVPNLGPLAQEMLLANSIGTINVLEFAKNFKSKILFTSSSEVYGDPKISPQAENYTGNVDTTGVRSPYEEGKRFAESLISMYMRKYKLDAKIVRVFNTYGPGMSSSDTRVIPKFLNQALNDQPITIHGKGLQRRTFCYVDDLVTGLITVMEKGKVGEVYNLGSDAEISIVELAQTILNLTKTKGKIKFMPRPPHDHQARLPLLEKISKLGWCPKTLLLVGLKNTIISFEKTKIPLYKKPDKGAIWRRFQHL